MPVGPEKPLSSVCFAPMPHHPAGEGKTRRSPVRFMVIAGPRHRWALPGRHPRPHIDKAFAQECLRSSNHTEVELGQDRFR